MVRSIWPAEPFNRAGAIFFAFVLMALGIATFTNVPLSFYGAFPLFRVLDTGRFVIDRGRLIDVPLQLPMPIALRFADSLAALRPSFCIAYATIPGVGLAVSLLVCKSRRPSLFIWPAMSICVVGLPGQCSLHSKAIMAVTLLWPALLAVLVDAPAKLWPLVAITSIATVCAHPNAAAVLASIVLVASFSARIRPQSRKRSLLFGSALGVLVVLRALMPLDPYESPHACRSNCDHGAERLRDTMAAHRDSFGDCCRGTVAAKIAWPQLQDLRLFALPVIGAIFFLVFSIQSLLWGVSSRRLADQLALSGKGRVSVKTVLWTRNTALDYWPVVFYAIELQDRKPRTLLLTHDAACRLFAHNGEVNFVDDYFRDPGESWFDFENALSRTRKGKRLAPRPGSK